MAILFAGSSLSDFSNITSYVTNSLLTEYLMDTVVEGVRIKGGTGSFDFLIQESTDFWLSFTLAAPVFTANTASQTGSLLSIFNVAYSATNPLFRIRGASAVYSLQFWNGSSYTTIGTVNGINTEGKARWDVHVKISDTEGVFEVYKDGTLVGPAAPVDTKLIAGVSGANMIRLHNPSGWVSGVLYFSGVIVSTTDTRGLQLIQTTPVSAGEMTEWTGSYADVDDTDINDADFITSSTVGSISTFDFGTIPTEYNSMEIEAVVLAFRGQSGGGAVASLEGVARIAGTNHTKQLEKALPSIYGPAQAIFHNNPTTTGPWTTAQVRAAEFGVRASA